MKHMLHTTAILKQAIIDTKHFVIISGTPEQPGLPVVTFHLKPAKAEEHGYDEFHVSERLRMAGWVVPAYTLARDNDKQKVGCGVHVFLFLLVPGQQLACL